MYPPHSKRFGVGGDLFFQCGKLRTHVHALKSVFVPSFWDMSLSPGRVLAGRGGTNNSEHFRDDFQSFGSFCSQLQLKGGGHLYALIEWFGQIKID